MKKKKKSKEVNTFQNLKTETIERDKAALLKRAEVPLLP